MTTVEIQNSSSDEEDFIYLDSVAKLKAFKQNPLVPQDNDNIEDVEIVEVTGTEETEQSTGVSTRTRSRTRTRGNSSARRPRRQRQVQRNNSQESNSDVEIVSVEENQSNSILIPDENINASFHEDENYEISVKILWRSMDVHSINLRRTEQFRKVFEHFSKLEQVSIDDILIMNKDKPIKKNDTPASIDLSIIDILDGGIVERSGKKLPEDDGEDVCVIKIQTGAKKKVTVRVRRDENFKNLLEKCSQELGIEKSKIKLYFDGELITSSDTPASLDIEDEACFDVRVSSG